MTNNKAKEIIQQLLRLADIQINGNNPWDIQIKNEDFYKRILHQTSLGLGEAYMDGWWECTELDQFFYRILRANLEDHIRKNWYFLFRVLHLKFQSYLHKIINYQSRSRALIVGKHHYDIDNQLYQYMLDPYMNYSCGYWKNSYNLNAAQLAKLELICQKLQLQPGMKVLDIGCGWGSFAKYAAEKYQVSIIGITISKQQYEFAKKICAGLPIEIRFQDYRDINEKFDRICSIGMFEHVGYKNYHRFMQSAYRCLHDEGLFLLHTIGGNISTTWPDAWIDKYIFPNGMLPSIKQIGASIEKLFVMEDWHNFGVDYDRTLLAWHDNFNQYWDKLKAHYDERFYRMWRYYLLSCAGAFRARDVQLWQIILTKKGLLGGYQSIR